MGKLKIGLYGGSFDPIHKGHIQLAKNAFEALQLDELILIPSFQSMDDKSLHAKPEDRLAMCHIVANNNEHYSVSDFEVTQSQPVPTYKTLSFFRDLYPDADLYWLLGSDQAINLNSWQNPLGILELAKIVVYPRHDKDIPKFLRIQGSNYPIMSNPNEFADANILYLAEQPLLNYASSTLKNAGDHAIFEESLEPEILTYIQNNNLYEEFEHGKK